VEKRAGSDAIIPALRKKKAISGTYPAGKLHLTLGSNSAVTAWLSDPYAFRAQTHESRVLAEPFNNTKIWARGQRIVGAECTVFRSFWDGR
jgi:hypothetical protein